MKNLFLILILIGFFVFIGSYFMISPALSPNESSAPSCSCPYLGLPLPTTADILEDCKGLNFQICGEKVCKRELSALGSTAFSAGLAHANSRGWKTYGVGYRCGGIFKCQKITKPCEWN